ncbi:alpha/beta hydrolase [Caulobacter segnis]
MINRRGLAALAALAAALPSGAGAGAGAVDATTGALRVDKMRSASVPGEVAVGIYLPPGYGATPGKRYPLVLLMHGGGGSERDLARFAPVIDQAIRDGRTPPLVVATPSARRSLYMDYRDGSERWETFVVSELLPHLRASLDVSSAREETLLGGWSMGGLGSLRLAFKHPDLFGAVAALEPAIEPALTWDAIGPRVKFWRSDEIYQRVFGTPVDTAFWAENNPASIAQRDPRRLIDLGVYLDVGDQDLLYLNQGVEFLHRVLFDAGVAHEYRLVQGGEHVGSSLVPRLYDALGFIGRRLDPPAWIDAAVLATRAAMDDKKRAAGLPVEVVDPRRIRGS